MDHVLRLRRVAACSGRATEVDKDNGAECFALIAPLQEIRINEAGILVFLLIAFSAQMIRG